MSARGTRAARTVAAMLVAAVTVLAFASAAQAASYHVFLCRIPYGPNAGAAAPTADVVGGREGPPAAFGTSCAGGATSSMFTRADGPILIGIGASVTYAPGAGVTISGFRLWRAMQAVGSSAAYDFISNIYYDGTGVVDGICAGSSGPAGCGRGTTVSPLDPANIVDSPPGISASSVGWQAYCGGADRAFTCPVGGGAFTNVYAADMRLEDPTAPGVGALSGPLLSGSPVSGTQTVSFPASDGASGVFRGRLLVDGKVAADQVLDANGGSCANLGVAPDARPSYLATRPCPAVTTGTLALDTTTLAVGTHTLTVAVSDAAGNETAVGPRTFSVTRAAIASPDSPAGTVPLSGPNGSGASRAAKLSARLVGSRKGVRTLAFAREPIVSGRLLDEHGAAISGAVIEVRARQRRTGAKTTTIASPTTGADGRFRSTLASGPSRTITVRYTAFGGDDKPAASVRTRTLVRASLTAAFSPRAPRAGQRVRLSGRLRYLPRARVLVAVQARDRGVWRTIDTVETRANGVYSWRYRFLARNAGRRFAFRARVKSPNYPFDAGASKPTSVRVRR